MKKEYIAPTIIVDRVVVVEEFSVGSLSANIYIGDDLSENLFEVEATIDNSSFGNGEISL